MTGTSMCEGGVTDMPAMLMLLFVSGEVALVEVDVARAEAEDVDVRGVEPADADADAASALMFSSRPCSNERSCSAVFATLQASRWRVQWLRPSFQVISSSSSSFLFLFRAVLRFEMSCATLSETSVLLFFSSLALTAAISFWSSSESSSEEA